MFSSNVGSVTKYFSTAAEGFSTTLGSTISAGATSVGLNSTSGLTTGNVFVGIIEPGATAQQVFTGTVDVSGSQITNVVWVRGTNVGHAAGVSIVDYVSGAAHNMMTAGILKQHTQGGLHTGITNTGGLTTDTLAATGNSTIGGTLGVTGTATHSGATVLTGAVSGPGYDVKTINNSYKFGVYIANGFNATTSAAAVPFDTALFDSGTNVDIVTNKGRFTAPVAGFYFLTSTINIQDGVGSGADFYIVNYLYKNGSVIKKGIPGTTRAGVGGTGITDLVQLAANDYVEVYVKGGTTLALDTAVSTSRFEGFLVSAT